MLQHRFILLVVFISAFELSTGTFTSWKKRFPDSNQRIIVNEFTQELEHHNRETGRTTWTILMSSYDSCISKVRPYKPSTSLHVFDKGPNEKGVLALRFPGLRTGSNTDICAVKETKESYVRTSQYIRKKGRSTEPIDMEAVQGKFVLRRGLEVTLPNHIKEYCEGLNIYQLDPVLEVVKPGTLVCIYGPLEIENYAQIQAATIGG